jgi:hypothetical protein
MQEPGLMPPAPPGKRDPLFALTGKRAMKAVAIIFAVIIIGVIAVVLLFQPHAGSAITSPQAAQAVVKTLTSTVTPDQARQPVALPAPDSAGSPVDFALEAGPQTKCGLTCRELTPSITNTGTETAHNVCISLVMYNSGGDLIFLNGMPSFTQCVGDIDGGGIRSEPIVINADCGFLASKCLGRTLILQTQAACNERTVRFPDQQIAV